MNKSVFTCGDINGIGPEIVIKTLNRLAAKSNDKFVFICPQNVFEETLKIVEPHFNFHITGDAEKIASNGVTILSLGKFKLNTGKPTARSGRAAFESIKYSYRLLERKICDSVITAPISKNAIHLAGENFPGHTEMYAQWSKVNNYVMMFLSEKMNAALFTIHEPVKNISRLLNQTSLKRKIEIVIKTLQNDLHISFPKIAVLGLNPHAGENGLIGKEEIEIIKPVLDSSKYSEYLSGPFSPDAFFANHLYKKYDLVFGMYHDQALIPFKLINFGSGVNYTAGLPIVRTSPDHGTAFDIAGQGIADESSMMKAYLYAKKIVRNRNSNEPEKRSKKLR